MSLLLLRWVMNMFLVMAFSLAIWPNAALIQTCWFLLLVLLSSWWWVLEEIRRLLVLDDLFLLLQCIMALRSVLLIRLYTCLWWGYLSRSTPTTCICRLWLNGLLILVSMFEFRYVICHCSSSTLAVRIGVIDKWVLLCSILSINQLIKW